jgi:hypothetical protein
MAQPSDDPLRFIPRMEFATQHFPQAGCTGCYHRRICTVLLSMPPESMRGDFWLVRGNDGECARNYSERLPFDVQQVREREVGRLSSMSGGAPSLPLTKRRRVTPVMP